MIVAMGVPMAVVIRTAQQPRADDIDDKTENCNRDRLAKTNGNRREETADGFIADEQRDHGQDDCTRETRQIAELTRAENEAAVLGVLSGCLLYTSRCV